MPDPAPPTYAPMALSELARHLVAAEDEDERHRLVREFLEEFSWAPAPERARLLAEEPAPTGDRRWDAFLGGLAEHLAAADGVEASGWATDAGRFLPTSWFWSDLPTLRVQAFVHSPAAFRRRAIFIDRRDLTRDGIEGARA